MLLNSLVLRSSSLSQFKRSLFLACLYSLATLLFGCNIYNSVPKNSTDDNSRRESSPLEGSWNLAFSTSTQYDTCLGWHDFNIRFTSDSFFWNYNSRKIYGRWKTQGQQLSFFEALSNTDSLHNTRDAVIHKIDDFATNFKVIDDVLVLFFQWDTKCRIHHLKRQH